MKTLATAILLGLAASLAGCDDFSLRRGDDGSDRNGGSDSSLQALDSCYPDAGATPQGEAGAPVAPSPAADGAAAAGALPISAAAIGAPTWRVECAYAFAAPCGGKANAFATAISTASKVLPAHKHFPAQNVMGPGVTHGQYAQELPAGIKAAGYAPASSFSLAELALPSCVFVLLQVVPASDAPVGASPDFAFGPILDPKAFPLLIDGSLKLGGKLVDPALDFVYPGKQALTPEPPGQGYSHLPLVFFENSELAGNAAGLYTLELRIVDALKQGWSVSVSYTVK
jgi:hypothetical protein